MQKLILTVVGSALIVSSMVQMATAAERHHRDRTADRVTVQSADRIRNSNAYYAPAPVSEPNFANYSGAGH